MAWLGAVGAWIAANYAAIATVGTVASLAGTAVSAWASIQSGREQEAAAKYNAQMELIQGVREKAAKQLEERQHRENTQRLLARQTALYLKAGVTMEGTPLEVIGQTAAEAEMDAMMIRTAGQGAYLERLGRMGMFREMGASYRQAGYLRAGTTLLTGAGRAMVGYGGIPKQKTGTPIPNPEP